MTPVRPQATRLLSEATETLQAAGVDSPRNDAELLLCYVLGVPRSMVATAAVDGKQREAFAELIAARATRIPLQHLTGSMGFRYIEVEVGPGVFVPRPETEVMTGWAIDRAREFVAAGSDPVVVELCAGSGAISLAFLHEVPQARVHAVELDEGAIGWAQRNLAESGVDLRHGDMADEFTDLDGEVDVVIANPPYIPVSVWDRVAPEARDHDPDLALWSGSDGLDAIRIVEQTAWRLLRPGGVVTSEHARPQSEAVLELFASRWLQVRDNNDLTDRPRFVTARRP